MNILRPCSVRSRIELVTAQRISLSRLSASATSVCYLHLDRREVCSCKDRPSPGRVTALKSFYESIGTEREARKERDLYKLAPNVKERVTSFEKMATK